MGCSFCKKEIKVQVSNVNQAHKYGQPSILSHSNQIHNDPGYSISVKKADNEDQLQNSSYQSSPISKVSKPILVLKNMNSSEKSSISPELRSDVKSKMLNINYKSDQKSCKSASSNFQTKVTKKTESNLTYKIIENLKDDMKLNIFFHGKNSKFTMEYLTKIFVSKNLLNRKKKDTEKLNNLSIGIEDSLKAKSGSKYTSPRKSIEGMLFEVTELGMDYMKNMKDKKYNVQLKKDQMRNASNSQRRLNSIVKNALSLDKKKLNLHGDNSNRGKIFVDCNSYIINYNIIEEDLKVLNQLSVYDSEDKLVELNQVMIFLSFDYRSKDSFQYIVDLLDHSSLRGLRVIVIGVKDPSVVNDLNSESKNSNNEEIELNLNTKNFIDSLRPEEQLYEVNEDFAKLTFDNLNVEFFSLNASQKLNTNCFQVNKLFTNNFEEEVDKAKEEYQLSLEERLFLSMFILYTQ